MYVLVYYLGILLQFAVRFVEQFEVSETVKFVYIRWVGENVAFTKRGKYGVVEGAVKQKLNDDQASVSACIQSSTNMQTDKA